MWSQMTIKILGDRGGTIRLDGQATSIRTATRPGQMCFSSHQLRTGATTPAEPSNHLIVSSQDSIPHSSPLFSRRKTVGRTSGRGGYIHSTSQPCFFFPASRWNFQASSNPAFCSARVRVDLNFGEAYKRLNICSTGGIL